MSARTDMRRHFLQANALGALALAAGCSRSDWVQSPSIRSLPDETAESRKQLPSHSNPAIAVSLRSLQTQHREDPASIGIGTTGYPILPGLNRIGGFLLEPQDVILFGAQDPSRPDLELDSLVVSLRNAFDAGEIYRGTLGCTIDPIPGNDPFRIQTVGVFAMDRTCLTAARFVALDHELKLVGGGVEQENGKILPSAFELSGEMGRCGQTEKAVSMTHRYYFYPKTPPAPRFERDDQTVSILQPLGVQLLTEQEFLNRRGERVGRAEPNETAKKFASAVDALLAAERVERYTRLVNDFRMSEVAKLLHYAGTPKESLAYLLSEYSLARVEVPRFIAGVHRREQGSITCDATVTTTPDAASYKASVLNYSREYRGGVEVQIGIAKSDFREVRQDGVPSLREKLLLARPSAQSVTWHVSGPRA